LAERHTNDGIANSDSYQSNIWDLKLLFLKFSEENNCNVMQNPSSNSSVCLGNKLVFNTNPGYNYLWTGPNNFTSTLQNPFIEM
jgi:hypothetical protein